MKNERLTLDNLNRLADIEDILTEDHGFIDPGLTVGTDANGSPVVTVHFVPSDLADDLVGRFGGVHLTPVDVVLPL